MYSNQEIHIVHVGQIQKYIYGVGWSQKKFNKFASMI